MFNEGDFFVHCGNLLELVNEFMQLAIVLLQELTHAQCDKVLPDGLLVALHSLSWTEDAERRKIMAAFTIGVNIEERFKFILASILAVRIKAPPVPLCTEFT